MAALQQALAGDQMQGIVLASGLRAPGQGFSGGSDLAGLGRPWPRDVPKPADITRLMLAAPCVVVAALHGPTLGAGAEIALAARGRVAQADLRFGLRDVLVGRLPMAGATQTLPRLIGATEALRLLGKGPSIPAAEALAMGLIDAVCDGDLLDAALAMVHTPPAAGRAPGLRDGRAYQVALAQARVAGASVDLLRCLEAAQLLPTEQGLDFEAEVAADVLQRPQTAALQHLTMAEMRMAADLHGGQPVPRLGLWGAAGGPLIWPALRAGMTVVLADDDGAALVAAVEKVAIAQSAQVAAGRMSVAEQDANWARLIPAHNPDALAGLPLVIAAKPGMAGQHLQFGHWPGAADHTPRLHLIAPAFAELQVLQAPRGWALMAAATLRQMRMRLGVTQAPPAHGAARALVLAAQQACRCLLMHGIPGDRLQDSLKDHLHVPLPASGVVAQSTTWADMEPQAIRHRIMGAIAAEGARLVMQGVVRRAESLDVLGGVALGMPRHLGGPLFATDQRGLMLLRRDLQLWQRDHAIWAPPALLDRLVSTGARLCEVDSDQQD